MLQPNGDLVSGGDFTFAGRFAFPGTQVSAYFARYTFGSPAPTIASHPQNLTTCPSATAIFSVTAEGADPGKLEYQWQWQPAPAAAWTDINDGLNTDPKGGPIRFSAQNSGSATLSLNEYGGGTQGSHWDTRCIISTPCGSVTSNPATFTLCPADFNCDAFANSQDFFDFLAAFFAGC
ncbi:MAG: hypothetical protein H7210_09500 [Pyrinomonadaceae bacterium]|nr:hypothetical protein [Phycisphaerales bacterium]